MDAEGDAEDGAEEDAEENITTNSFSVNALFSVSMCRDVSEHRKKES